ncbi:MAG: DUF3224 domain-containing protein [Acidobacteria bacterium]|nr:DUF3224 domain-containing protein [Acidobacteriota bacterium]
MPNVIFALALLLVEANPKGTIHKMITVEGSFEVKMQPPPEGRTEFVRLLLDKSFQGGLVGTSKVEMLASHGGDQPVGGYVALERFTGKLEGKQGSFAMQHSGTMKPGSMEIQVLVTPGSGTGELAGIEGQLEIRKDGKLPFDTLRYRLGQ